MSSKRKLEASDLLPSLHPPRLVREDELDDGDTATLYASGFLPFFSMLADDDDEDESDEEDRHSAVTLSSAIGHMHIDVTDDDNDNASVTGSPALVSVKIKKEEEEHEIKVKPGPAILPTIRPRAAVGPSSSSSSALLLKKEPKPKQQHFHVNEAGDEHPVYFSTAEITDITRRLSDLYGTLRHVQCQVQIHSLEETDVPVQGPDELKEARIPVLQLSFIERELCVAFSPTRDVVVAGEDDDNVFSDVRAAPRRYSPCARGDQCVGLTGQWASLYADPNINANPNANPNANANINANINVSDPLTTPFPGAILPALFYPEEMDHDNGHVAKSRHRPCFFCLIKQIHETWLVFAVNRLSAYNLAVAPIQCFSNVHGDGEFNRSVLLQPGTHKFNGLVKPILMYVHSKLVWDFDPGTRQWKVNIDALKHPKSAVLREPGVVTGPSNPSAKISSKKPLNSSGETSVPTASS